MSRTLHLHVGMPKCSSTSLQMFLAKNRAQFRAESFDYPRLATGNAGNLTPYVMSLRPDKARASFVRGNPGYDFANAEPELRSAIETSTANNMILSSEALSHPLFRVDIGWISQMFSAIKFHLFFRPRASLIVSNYNQGLQVGEIHGDIGTYLANPLLKTGGLFSRQLAYWQSCAGQDAVHIHFLSTRFPPAIQQFLTAIGSDIVETPRNSQWRNKSLSAFVLCALAHSASSRGSGSVQQRREIIAMAQQFDPDPEMTLLTPEITSQIDAQFASDTEEFIKMQNVVTRQDLETDTSQQSRPSISFAEIIATSGFQAFQRQAELALNVPK